MADTHPHITIGHHARYGVVAATSHDSHVAEHMLRRVGFERLPDSNMYALTDSPRDTVRRGGQAVQSLRAARYSVVSDAAYDLQPVTHKSSDSNVPFDAFSHIRGRGQLDPDLIAQQRRAQVAIAASPARSSATPHWPAISAEHRPPPAPAQRIRAR
ncbi:hypothetical protein ACIRJS_38380 [Streptomyces sp. NPDC102340]|uniref:hypothetical protein n=1 Tax=unclassified Streptomyces TaxID=2593676 RepID=UPI0037F79290